MGSYVNGQPRLQVLNWSSCKIAHLRSDQPEGERPALGRKPKPHPNPPTVENTLTSKQPNQVADAAGLAPKSVEAADEPAKIQMESDTRESKKPIITREMFDKWTPELFNLPSRPVRSTRNPQPNYVGAMIAA